VFEEPTLHTERLVLRPFVVADAPAVHALVAAREVADTTLNIPHPYPDGAAAEWIATHAAASAAGAAATYAVTESVRDQAGLPAAGPLVGAVSLVVDRRHDNAELGYWIGVPFWGKGYCTEAARAVVRYGFEVLGLHRVHAMHFARNPASGRVMQKLGMRLEGCRREHVRKWDGFEDVALYGILVSDWRAAAAAPGDRGERAERAPR
jgi:RimJ/RimL family protein N-acetyltransferase